MGQLITVVGNSAAGKTSLVQALCTAGGFGSGLEQHRERPFQQLFASSHRRYALANQLDYLLLRAEQELQIRRAPQTGVQDGGLDQDFFVFTRLFTEKGFLNQAEFSLCERAYRFYRHALPPPDLIVWLQAPLTVIQERFAARQRELEIARLGDLEIIERLLDDWLSRPLASRLVKIDASLEDRHYQAAIREILSQLSSQSG